MATIQYPENADLRSLLRFAAEDGLIWLGEHRMLLLHAGAMAELRKELIESVGREQARRVAQATDVARGIPVDDESLARALACSAGSWWRAPGRRRRRSTHTPASSGPRCWISPSISRITVSLLAGEVFESPTKPHIPHIIIQQRIVFCGKQWAHKGTAIVRWQSTF